MNAQTSPLSVVVSCLVLAVSACSDSPSDPGEQPTTGEVTLTLPMEPAEELWDAFYGSTFVADPELLPPVAARFPGVTSVEALRALCLPFLQDLKATFTGSDGVEHVFAFDGTGDLNVELPPGTYALSVDVPVDVIQNPFALRYDATAPQGRIIFVHPDSAEASDEDALSFRVDGVVVELGGVTALGTLDVPDVGAFLGAGAEAGGMASLSATAFRPATYVNRISVTNEYWCDALDADSQGNFFLLCERRVSRFDSSPMEFEKSEYIYDNDRRANDLAVKHEGAYLYGASNGLGPTTTHLQRFGKISFDEFGEIDLDKWDYDISEVRRWAISSGGYLFARDAEGALVIADLGDDEYMKFDDISLWEDEDDDGEQDNDVFTYDVAAVHYEYNYAYVAGERRGGSRTPGVYKISRSGNMLRTFGHSDNVIPKEPGTLAVDRLRNVYVVRVGGSTSGYFGDDAYAITVYDKSGDYLGYLDLSDIEDDLDNFRISDITVNLDDELFVLARDGSNTRAWVYKYRLDL